MDREKLSEQRRKLLEKTEEYEREGKFDCPIEDDPPAPVLMPGQCDYLCKKLSSKILRRISYFVGRIFFEKCIKNGVLIIDNVEDEEYLEKLVEKGTIITCNHFSPFDNYIVYRSVKAKKKRLFKVIREGNYTNFPGLFGFLFRHCDTLPLSSNRRTMLEFMSATDTLLNRGEAVLIYPEQEMWRDYRKPRPFKIGAFRIAVKSNAPVLPMFITMQDDETKVGEDGYPVQHYTLHIMPPVYPDSTLPEKERAQKLMDDTYEKYVKKYEEVYQTPLTFACGEVQ